MISLGGTAGCIVASRLAAADPNLRILVIEAGRNNHNDPSIKFPAFFPQNLLPGSKFTKVLHGSKAKELGGREVVVAGGCGLGGGSSINAAMYVRGHPNECGPAQIRSAERGSWPYKASHFWMQRVSWVQASSQVV